MHMHRHRHIHMVHTCRYTHTHMHLHVHKHLTASTQSKKATSKIGPHLSPCQTHKYTDGDKGGGHTEQGGANRGEGEMPGHLPSQNRGRNKAYCEGEREGKDT